MQSPPQWLPSREAGGWETCGLNAPPGLLPTAFFLTLLPALNCTNGNHRPLTSRMNLAHREPWQEIKGDKEVGLGHMSPCCFVVRSPWADWRSLLPSRGPFHPALLWGTWCSAVASPATGFSSGDEYSTHTSVTSFIIKPSQIVLIPGGTLRCGTTPVLSLFWEQRGVQHLTWHRSCDHPVTAVEALCLVFLPGVPSLLGA